LGNTNFFDPEKVVAHPELSLATGAIDGWDKRNQFYFQMIQSLARHYGFDVQAAWETLPEKVKKVVLHGSGKEVIDFTYLSERGTTFNRSHAFEGIIPNLERRYRETDSETVREKLREYQNHRACPSCGGARLRKEARYVYVSGEPLHEVSAWPLTKTHRFFETLDLDGNKKQIAEKILKEITERLGFLINVGLDYLNLSRSAETLSGGEAQRIRLASQIGSGLTGVMYVLDEPSIGLHQRDNDRLLATLKRLRDLGNSVIVVEHDEDAIREADFVVDMGPGAGEHGGNVLIADTPENVAKCEKSVTGQYLSGKKSIAVPSERTPVNPDRMLVLKGARGNNLKNVTLELPLGLITCITGVSGSGKSTLINDTLAKITARELNRAQEEPAPYDDIRGLEHLDKVINVDQSPIGRTPRSNPATYTGLFTPIRELFAGVPLSRERGYNVGRFSFNVKGGRCEACQGDGVIKVEMHFLPDVYVPCEVCHGKRYNRETLEIQYKGKNISQVLDMTVEEAREFFDAVPTVSRKLQTLMDVGLGYIRLGQSATTLSGGEAQRVKLALELSKRDTGRTLYILDEPTTGLHFADIALLLEVIGRLKGKGNSIVIIEHNLDVIKTADWIVDLGPEGGDGGGRIIASGSPEQVAKVKGSYTGKYLKTIL
ncbi:excinuclease ABC subunit UvrA, partial [uncultured Neisseria sp.]|uniref:excinuclease ABC subunit UvrA n=1 Tax=uncultured Neisseria sp. TaxID=237778 RepID=UPI00263331F7